MVMIYTDTWILILEMCHLHSLLGGEATFHFYL